MSIENEQKELEMWRAILGPQAVFYYKNDGTRILCEKTCDYLNAWLSDDTIAEDESEIFQTDNDKSLRLWEIQDRLERVKD